jgi:hypothetical protein
LAHVWESGAHLRMADLSWFDILNAVIKIKEGQKCQNRMIK